MAQETSQLTDSQVFILKSLAKYSFLTVKQMQNLGYDISRTQLYSKLKPMREEKKPLIKSLDFGSIPGEGRLDVIYHLSDRGASVLEDLGIPLDNIKFPKRVRAFNQDYNHRISCINFQIALDNWARKNTVTVDSFETYFDYGKAMPKGRGTQKTSISWGKNKMVPDAVFSFTSNDGVKRLCCLEQHNGDDASRLINQIEVYSQALQARAIEDNKDYPHSARVLIVFEKEKCLQKAQTAFQKRDDLAAYRFNFYLKSNNDILNGDFKNNWRNLYDDEYRPLFG